MARAPVVYEGMVIESDNGPDLIRRGNQWVPVGTALAAGKLPAQQEKALEDARTASSNAVDVLGDLTRFQDINSHVSTGGLWNGAKNWIGQHVGNPEVQQLGEISARLTPAQRQPGSGTTSDRDLALYQQAVPSLNRSQSANNAIINRTRQEAVRRQQYSDFLDNYARQNGTLNGAESAFRGTIGLGTEQNPYSIQQAGDRSTLPRGAFYQSPEGLRRNDNGSRGNPIVKRGPGVSFQPNEAQARAFQSISASGPRGSVANPVILNPNDPGSGYANLQSGQYYIDPSGQTRKKR